MAEGSQTTSQASGPVDADEVLFTLLGDLSSIERRDLAVMEISKQRDRYPDLARVLWFSPGVVAGLLQEVLAVYPLLSPPNLSNGDSSRVCNALALLQVVATHPDTKGPFLRAHLPLYLYPFLNTVSRARPFEYLRLTCLGVIGALVKRDGSPAADYLLATEIIPLCLNNIEVGSDLSQTVAVFIVLKLLQSDRGLEELANSDERLGPIATSLYNAVQHLPRTPSPRLLKHIIRCYSRLLDNPRSKAVLRERLPPSLLTPIRCFGPTLSEQLLKSIAQLVNALGLECEIRSPHRDRNATGAELPPRP